MHDAQPATRKVELSPRTAGNLAISLVRFKTLFFVWLALILIAAAAFKFRFVATDIFADLKSGYPIPVLILGGMIELVVAATVLCALSWKRLEAAWILLITVFLSLFLVAIGRWVMGHPSCGCFGDFEIPTWAIAGLDAVFVGILLSIQRRPFSGLRTAANQLVAMVGSINSAWLGCLCAVIVFASTIAILGADGIQRLVAQPPIDGGRVYLPDLHPNQFQTIALRLSNSSAAEALVIGVSRSCSCVVVNEDRQSIPPGNSVELSAKVAAKSPGYFHQRVVFFLDHPNQQRVAFDLIGQIK